MTDLYQDAIVVLAKAANRAGRLDRADASLTRDNPLCGDRVTLDIRLDGARIADIAHRVRGCLLCEAAASVIGAHAIGKSADDVAAARQGLRALLETGEANAGLWPCVDSFAPVRSYASRHSCVLLPFETLHELLTQATAGKSP